MATISNFTPELYLDIINNPQQQPFIPDNAAFNWCLEQQVVHSNNIELYAIAFVLAAYIFILLYGMEDVEILKKYQPEFIYMAKLMLIAFFVIYIIVIRLSIYY